MCPAGRTMSLTEVRGRAAVLVASWFGCGFSPIAPGTAGSLAAILVAWALGARWAWTPGAIGVLGLVTIFPAIWTAEVTALRRGQKDPGVVVIDEVVGQWLALMGAPTITGKTCLAAFVLFRALDIWKPFPARRLEKLPGGLGIVADDVMAGIYAALVLFAAGCFNLY